MARSGWRGHHLHSLECTWSLASLPSVYRAVLPYVAIMLAVVLLITFWPAISVGVVAMLGIGAPGT